MPDPKLALLNTYEVHQDGVTHNLVCFLDPVLAGSRGIDPRSIIGSFTPGADGTFDLQTFRLNPEFVAAFTQYMNEAATLSPELLREAAGLPERLALHHRSPLPGRFPRGRPARERGGRLLRRGRCRPDRPQVVPVQQESRLVRSRHGRLGPPVRSPVLRLAAPEPREMIEAWRRSSDEGPAGPALATPARRVGLQEQDPLAPGDDATLPGGPLPPGRRRGDQGRPLRGHPLRHLVRPRRPDLHVAPGVARLPDRRRVPPPGRPGGPRRLPRHARARRGPATRRRRGGRRGRGGLGEGAGGRGVRAACRAATSA